MKLLRISFLILFIIIVTALLSVGLEEPKESEHNSFIYDIIQDYRSEN